MTNTQQVLLNLISLENKSKLQFVLRSQRSAISDSTFQVSNRPKDPLWDAPDKWHPAPGNRRATLGRCWGDTQLQLRQGTLWQTFFVADLLCGRPSLWQTFFVADLLCLLCNKTNMPGYVTEFW